MFQFCKLGRLAHEVGWQYKEVVEKLEAKRKVKSGVYYDRKKTVDVSSNSIFLLDQSSENA